MLHPVVAFRLHLFTLSFICFSIILPCLPSILCIAFQVVFRISSILPVYPHEIIVLKTYVQAQKIEVGTLTKLTPFIVRPSSPELQPFISPFVFGAIGSLKAIPPGNLSPISSVA